MLTLECASVSNSYYTTYDNQICLCTFDKFCIAFYDVFHVVTTMSSNSRTSCEKRSVVEIERLTSRKSVEPALVSDSCVTFFLNLYTVSQRM